jgi:hypothetical protein
MGVRPARERVARHRRPSRRRVTVLGACAVLLGLGACGAEPDAPYTNFVVAVGDESFVVHTTRAEVAARARESLAGRRSLFPAGPLLRGDGGFNAPWTWRHDPERVDFVEAAIEVCDGRPSYVEEHLDDFLGLGYCPWGARVVSVRP